MEWNKTLVTGMVFLLALAVFLIPVQATINTPTVSFDNTKSYTTGTSVTVGVTVSGSSSSATISRLNLKEVDGLTVSDPASGEYTNYVATTSGTTKNFVVTAGTAGTYEIKAYALEQQATTVQESTTDYVTFVDPSVLRVSVDYDPAGNTYTGANQPFFLQIKIRNPLDTAITTYFNLSFNANAMNKSSGDPADDTITIPAHQTFIANWSFLSKTVSGTSYDISLSLGGESSHTSTVTINAATTPPPTTDGTTGGGGEITTPSASTSKSWSKVTAGEEATMAIDNAAVAPTQIKFTLIAEKTSVEMAVAALSAKPSTIAEDVSGEAYKYFSITTTNIEETNVQSAKIKFRVNNTWISDNQIDMNKVSLYRYASSQWNKLTTVYVSRDDTYTYYEAESPGFSTFAVAGEKLAGAAVCTAGEKRCTGNDLEQCITNATAWEKLETCGYGCNETTFSCNLAPPEERVCTPGEKRCVGNTLQECKSDASAWIAKEVCGYGCNTETLACNPAPAEPTAPSLWDYWWLILIIIVAVVVVVVFLYLRAGVA